PGRGPGHAVHLLSKTCLPTAGLTGSIICQFLCSFHHWCVCVCVCLCVCVSVCVCVCAFVSILVPPTLLRGRRQAPDGRRAAQGDDGHLAQPLPEAPGPPGHAAQV